MHPKQLTSYKFYPIKKMILKQTMAITYGDRQPTAKWRQSPVSNKCLINSEKRSFKDCQ